MVDSLLTIALEKLKQKYVLPEWMEPDANGLMTIAELLSKRVDPEKFSSWCKLLCSCLDKIVNQSLKNGYIHATLTANTSLGQSCFIKLMNINSANSNSIDQKTLLELIKTYKEKNINASNSTSIRNNLALFRSKSSEEIQTHSSDRFNNSEHKEASTDSDIDTNLEEPRVCKRPALGKPLSDQVVEPKKHNRQQMLKKVVNPHCSYEMSDESDDLFKPSTSRTVGKSKEKLVNNESAHSTKNSDLLISNDTNVSKHCGAKSRTIAHELSSKSKSDKDSYKLNEIVDLNSHLTRKDKNRSHSCDSESDYSSDSDASSENGVCSGRSKKRYCTKGNYKNRSDSQDFESESARVSQKETVNSKPKGKSSKPKPIKHTAKKPADSRKGKTNVNVKNNKKKIENKNEEASNQQDNEPASSSKFVERLKELESSILKGTPDPLEKKKATMKKLPATKSQKNKSEAAKSKDCVESKTKQTNNSSKNSQTVKSQKKTANEKTSLKKAPTKKAPTKKSQKATNKNEDKENVKTIISKDVKKLNNKEKPDRAKNKSKAVASNQVQIETVNISKKGDQNDPNSFFSSEEDSDLNSEPELGTLSACMSSIKRKIPRQTGTATPPLKIFLSSMCDAQSDILESEGSSFSDVPLKLDDKHVVKRMAKANKPKEIVKQDFTFKKLTKTPEALKKMMKLKEACNSESSVECSSFSDDN